MFSKKQIIVAILLSSVIFGLYKIKNDVSLPIIAIANYGSHTSLEEAIAGLKEELSTRGFIENKTIRYETLDVNFDTALIPQMIMKLKNTLPKVMVLIGTPIAQFAKNTVKNIPLVYNAVTDPVEAGLIKKANESDNNMTGSSEKQDLTLVLDFAKKLIPHAKTVGLLYSTAESNDAALLNMLKQAVTERQMKLLAIPIEQTRDIPIRMQDFKHKVDFIYVGVSGMIQPAFPTIATEAAKMHIPVLNSDDGYVKEGIAPFSFGVNYRKIGSNAGKLVASILNGIDITELAPVYPSIDDYHGMINMKQAKQFNISIPHDLKNIKIID